MTDVLKQLRKNVTAMESGITVSIADNMNTQRLAFSVIERQQKIMDAIRIQVEGKLFMPKAKIDAIRVLLGVPAPNPCTYCDGEPEPGYIEMPNNGPTVRCPVCNDGLDGSVSGNPDE